MQTAQSGFGVADGAVVAAYFVGTLWLGLKLGRKQKDARDYFVGDHRLPWWAISFSVIATETSALTFISIPALAYVGNLGFLQVAFGYLVGRLVVSALLLPRYYEGELVTAYALLEKRFGVGTRRFSSVTFMATRAFAASVRVFATSIPLALILGPILPAHWLAPVTILALSACSVVYTYFGGTRAVVWTDVVQMTTYLLGGVAALVLLGLGVDGGWGAILSRAADAHKLMLIDTSFVLNNPHTLWAGLFGGAFLSMASHGADQLIVQRLLGARNLADARRALFTDAVVVILQFGLFLMVGIGLWAYYDGRTFAQSDSIFPQFIVTVMPHGLRGLIVAALTAAAMGTISSSLNSLAAATTHDLWMPITKHRADEPETLRAARRFTLMWAAVLIGGALLYREQGTPVVVIALAIASFTYGPLLGGFFLGIFWKQARQRDAILGMSVAVVLMSVVVFAKQLSLWFPSLALRLMPFAQIAWPWYVLIGTSITLFIGILSSYLPLIHARTGIIVNSEQILVAGVDGGGTKTRLVLADGTGHALATVEGDGSALGGVDAKRSATIIAELAGQALDQAELSRETIATLCAGVAGAGTEDAHKALTRALKATDVAEEIIVTTDAHIALEDAFGDAPGIVLIAGTGSVAFGRSPLDVFDRCGGWGPLLGDEGSALWLVRRALNAATAAADGREPETALLGALMTTTECADATDLISWIAKSSNADIAALAPVVLSAAQAGDQRASTVTAIAAEELVLHVRTLARRLFTDERAAMTVAFSGGLLARGSLMRKLVEHRMRSAVPGAHVRHEDVDAARGAVRRALKGVRVG